MKHEAPESRYLLLQYSCHRSGHIGVGSGCLSTDLEEKVTIQNRDAVDVLRPSGEEWWSAGERVAIALVLFRFCRRRILEVQLLDVRLSRRPGANRFVID